MRSVVEGSLTFSLTTSGMKARPSTLCKRSGPPQSLKYPRPVSVVSHHICDVKNATPHCQRQRTLTVIWSLPAVGHEVARDCTFCSKRLLKGFSPFRMSFESFN